MSVYVFLGVSLCVDLVAFLGVSMCVSFSLSLSCVCVCLCVNESLCVFLS